MIECLAEHTTDKGCVWITLRGLTFEIKHQDREGSLLHSYDRGTWREALFEYKTLKAEID